MKRILFLTLMVVSSVALAQNGNSLWKSNTVTTKAKTVSGESLPQKSLYDLDLDALRQILISSPKRTFNNQRSNTILTLPNTDGAFETFNVFENSVMDPALESRYPEIKSYVAVGVNNPGVRVYFSFSPLGFKSMTLNPGKPTTFIEPVTSDMKTYTVYQKSDYKNGLSTIECSVMDQAISTVGNSSVNARPNADDAKLRTFRLALSCTGEYTTYFGGTKALALAGMNNTLTRVNGIFETDFGLRLVLIANTDSVIYTSAATDPYADATGMSSWNSQLQSTLTSVIGDANYDIGHLFGATGGGGNAGCIGCVCGSGKGSGYTSPSNGIPAGDNFDIDYVAHEMGHQLGANHTYTHVTEGTIAQVEPGSGSTIMSYAGITAKDVQRHSDPYFHAISIQQVTNNIKAKTCPTLTSTGNSIPAVDAGLDYTIPKDTPFMLKGTASDSNGDLLTYAWEEMDLGTATTTTPTATSTTGPAFRSYIPTTSSTRYFPRMETILTGSTTTAGTEVPWEVMPSVARTLNYRLTVRDNRAGGAANNSDDNIITVNGTAGPFKISSPNTAVTYAVGSTQAITWNVAGTTANGVNCANVDILLSTDGGLNFSTTLLSGTPNDGTENIVIPNITGSANRIMVKGSNHIFFDVSDSNFIILPSGPDTTPPAAVTTLSASGTTSAATNLSWSPTTDNFGVTSYDVYQNGVLKTSTTSTTTTLAVTGLLPISIYNYYVIAKDAAGNSSAASNTVIVTTLAVDVTAPSVPILTASGTTATTTNLSWPAATDNVGVTGYYIYQNGAFKATTSATSYAVTGLTVSTAYSFYIIARDSAGNISTASNTVSVTTGSTADTTAPSSTTLTASGTTASTTNLSWTAATDNIGVTGYNVYQNGILKTTVATTSYTVTGLSASTAYSFYIIAKDATGNLSASSNIFGITTLAAADTTAPSSTILTASGTTTTTTNLSWTAATDNVGVSGYSIYQNGILKTTVTTTSYTVTGLTASTSYSFIIIAKDAAGNTSVASNAANITTLAAADTTAPSSTTLTASGTTTTTTNLSWTVATDNVGVTGYNVYQNGILKTTVTTTSYAVTGLSASTAYSFYVVAKDASGNLSTSSNIASVTTLAAADTTAPSSTTLTASGTTTTTTNLSWTAATDNVGVTGYNVYQNGVLKTTVTTTSYAVTGLTSSTAYSFYIVAKDAAGNLSASSNVASVTTLAAADTTAPSSTTLTASGTTITTTNLSWTAATDNVGVTGYNVYQNGILRTTVTTTSYAVTGLSASTAYSFIVIAKDAAGNTSVASNAVNVTTLSAADTTAPSSTTLTASGTTTTSTNLSWTVATDNVGVTGYNVYQNGILKTTVTNTSYAVTGLSASSAYSFYVVAKDVAGNLSASSNVASVTTLRNAISYCTSMGNTSAREYINKVQLGSISNVSGNNGGYGNFTSMSTNLAIGSSNTITITPAWAGTVYMEAYRIWIDFNNDGDFADSGEQVFNQSKSKSTAISGTITIPTTALLGATRMRIAMKFNGAPSTCEAFSNGEVEDYTVNITASLRIEEEAIQKFDFKLYPNPVKGDILNISKFDTPVTFRIINMMGQELIKNKMEEDSIYVGQLKAGTYLIEVSDGETTTTKRFIKQ